MHTHFSVDLRLTNYKSRILIPGGAPFNQTILKCHVDHHNGAKSFIYRFQIITTDCIS